ncbi:hypothetical protein E3Q23_00706 [Wallemia mellicola]|nr:hypothetical protein E3Q23_00706 [Wallemia mellicola]
MLGLGSPPSVVFDEVHFGGQVSKYIKQRFFMDVHPPLAKLLLTAAAAIFGFNGNFSFEHIGDDYVVHDVQYIAMRAVPALLGVALTPLTYLICRSLQLKPISALLGSLLITFENALATQSRLILLDSPLVFFTALSTYSFIKFYNQNKSKTAHFTQEWWSWLFLTGLSLGAVLSVKWVGLFTVATIGVATVYQLWELLGNLSIPPRLLFKHFTTRALCLIVIPILFYLWMFAIHLSILNRSGGGDTFMSAAFQHSLRGNRLQDTYAPVGMGSEVSIRHLHSTGGYLHSHEHDYPTGSFQQQITLYPYTDDNNIWQIVERSDNNGEPDHHDYHNEKFRQIYNGAVIRLMHLDTGKRLHSHDHKPPVSEAEFQNEVSGYGFEGFNGDANDNFKIEIVNGDSRDPSSYKELKAIKTHFRLKHVLSGCYLFSHKEKLPEWGYGQQEVTCNKQSPLENSIWYVEVNSHGQLEDNENVEMVNYRPMGFLEKFYELQSVMWDVNNGLLERHAFDSRPMSWPLFLRGINFWVKDHKQIYLIGNPVVWWLGFVAILGSGAYLGLLTLRNKRGYSDFDASTRHYTLISSFVASGLLDEDLQGQLPVPYCTYTDHTLPVKDLYVGLGEFPDARIYTSSLDQTVKIWSLKTRSLISTIEFPTALTSLAVDKLERRLYVASNNQIYRADLHERQTSLRAGDDDTHERVIKLPRETSITTLSFSVSANTIYLGCQDGLIECYDVRSHQHLRTMGNGKNALADIKSIIKPIDLGGVSSATAISANVTGSTAAASSALPPILPFGNLKKTIGDSDRDNHSVQVRTGVKSVTDGFFDTLFDETSDEVIVKQSAESKPVEKDDGRVKKLEEELQESKVALEKANKINEEMWDAVNKLKSKNTEGTNKRQKK